MRNFIFSVLTLAVAGSSALLAPLSVQAVAVGLSPSVMDLVMHEGQVAEVFYSVSRSETAGDFSLEVTANDESGAIKLPNGRVVIIPDGRNNQTYRFEIDTNGLAVGDYSATLNFQEMLPQNSGEVLSIRYGLQGGLELKIVTKEEYNQLLSEVPVKLNRLSVNSDVIATKKGIPVSYEITNPGPLFIDRISHSIEVISSEGEVIERVDYSDTVNLAPHQNIVFNKIITIDTSGEYSLRVRASNDGQDLVENGTSIIVEEAAAVQHRRVELAVIVLSAAVLLGVLLAFKMKGRK